MIKAVSLEPAFQTTFTNGNHSALADVPIAKGGAGCGFGPHELLEAAFATCLGMTVRMYAEQHQFPLASVRCEVHIDRAATGPITLVYALSMEGNLSTEQRTRLLAAAAQCPVARTLTGRIDLRSAT